MKFQVTLNSYATVVEAATAKDAVRVALDELLEDSDQQFRLYVDVAVVKTE